MSPRSMWPPSDYSSEVCSRAQHSRCPSRPQPLAERLLVNAIVSNATAQWLRIHGSHRHKNDFHSPDASRRGALSWSDVDGTTNDESLLRRVASRNGTVVATERGCLENLSE